MAARAQGWAALAAAALAFAPAGARADRPVFASAPLTFDGDHVRVHYVTTSSDAVPELDADESGTPDFVEEVAAVADTAWDDAVSRGFRAPLGDAGLVADDGGDDRFDIYLIDLVAADGNFQIESCTDDPVQCAGFFAMENDLVGFNYDSITEGISVLTSHELFHAVQAAYAPDTARAWSEGTATWNEEQTYPDQDDYERLVPSFLSRSYRPFDRAGGGFSDLYAYGAALWPTFLDERYGDGMVRRIWETCAEAGPSPDFLDAVDEVLRADGGSLDAAWSEFTRWNLFTGERADPDRAYRAAGDLGDVLIEEELAGQGTMTVAVEGLSARYLPIDAGQAEMQVSVAIDDGAVAAFFPQAEAGGSIGDEVELVREEDVLVAPLPAEGRGILVITGIRRGGLPREASVDVGAASPGGDDSDGGCQAARSGSGRVPGTVALLLAAAAFVQRRLRLHHGSRGKQ
jgi:hypothetical protein